MGFISLSNFDFHFKKLNGAVACGQSHADCTTLCSDTANINQRSSAQAIVCFLCSSVIYVLARFDSTQKPEDCLSSLGIIRVGHFHPYHMQ